MDLKWCWSISGPVKKESIIVGKSTILLVNPVNDLSLDIVNTTSGSTTGSISLYEQVSKDFSHFNNLLVWDDNYLILYMPFLFRYSIIFSSEQLFSPISSTTTFKAQKKVNSNISPVVGSRTLGNRNFFFAGDKDIHAVTVNSDGTISIGESVLSFKLAIKGLHSHSTQELLMVELSDLSVQVNNCQNLISKHYLDCVIFRL